MRVEKALVSDINALVDLRIEYLREDNGSLKDSDVDMILIRLPEYLRNHLNRELFCYIVRDGDVIASCAFLLMIEKPMSPAFINGKTGTVLNVYTRPLFRHRGFARSVMEELIADAKRMELCVLELKATDAGYPLYQAVGFTDDISKYHMMKWHNR